MGLTLDITGVEAGLDTEASTTEEGGTLLLPTDCLLRSFLAETL
jgi:hypothetical protein